MHLDTTTTPPRLTANTAAAILAMLERELDRLTDMLEADILEDDRIVRRLHTALFEINAVREYLESLARGDDFQS